MQARIFIFFEIFAAVMQRYAGRRRISCAEIFMMIREDMQRKAS